MGPIFKVYKPDLLKLSLVPSISLVSKHRCGIRLAYPIQPMVYLLLENKPNFDNLEDMKNGA